MAVDAEKLAKAVEAWRAEQKKIRVLQEQREELARQLRVVEHELHAIGEWHTPSTSALWELIRGEVE